VVLDWVVSAATGEEAWLFAVEFRPARTMANKAMGFDIGAYSVRWETIALVVKVRMRSDSRA
jgi:hypothetical protein